MIPAIMQLKFWSVRRGNDERKGQVVLDKLKECSSMCRVKYNVGGIKVCIS